MGSAVWLYGWLVLRQTHQSGGIGNVLRGSPFTYREIEEETGFNRRTLEAWMRTLRREGYIETRLDRGGIVVLILKAKKHRKSTPFTLTTNQKASRADSFKGEPRVRVASGLGLSGNAEDGPPIGVASGGHPERTQSFAEANGSSFVDEINKSTETQNRDQRKTRGNTFRVTETKAVPCERAEQSNLRVNPSYIRTNRTISKSGSASMTDGEIRSANVSPTSQFGNKTRTTTPSPSHGFARAYNPHETKLPWELRKRMQLERTTREEELRRELYVGTGPEVRRT